MAVSVARTALAAATVEAGRLNSEASPDVKDTDGEK